jgi:hypothetical protein
MTGKTATCGRTCTGQLGLTVWSLLVNLHFVAGTPKRVTTRWRSILHPEETEIGWAVFEQA